MYTPAITWMRIQITETSTAEALAIAYLEMRERQNAVIPGIFWPEVLLDAERAMVAGPVKSGEILAGTRPFRR